MTRPPVASLAVVLAAAACSATTRMQGVDRVVTLHAAEGGAPGRVVLGATLWQRSAAAGVPGLDGLPAARRVAEHVVTAPGWAADATLRAAGYAALRVRTCPATLDRERVALLLGDVVTLPPDRVVRVGAEAVVGATAREGGAVDLGYTLRALGLDGRGSAAAERSGVARIPPGHAAVVDLGTVGGRAVAR